MDKILLISRSEVEKEALPLDNKTRLEMLHVWDMVAVSFYGLQDSFNQRNVESFIHYLYVSIWIMKKRVKLYEKFRQAWKKS